MNLKDALSGKLTKKELSLLKTSFDIIGDIAIIEVPNDLKKKENMIAKTLLIINKNVKTVYKKSGERKGKFRLRKLKKIIGNGPETIHKESGCLFKQDVEKSYFSVRESTERLRISEKIRPKENVLVLFSGVGPFGIVIAKKHPDCKIDMVEVNTIACKYAEENIRINRVADRIKNYCGNFKEIGKQLGRYNKILMPLPETAYKYLENALENNSKKGSMIYLYCIEGQKGGYHQKTLDSLIKKKKIKILEKRKVLPYAPGVYKYCIELMVI